MFSVLFLGFIGVTTYAQGTWKATGSESAILPSTAITMGIANLNVCILMLPMLQENQTRMQLRSLTMVLPGTTWQ